MPKFEPVQFNLTRRQILNKIPSDDWIDVVELAINLKGCSVGLLRHALSKMQDEGLVISQYENQLWSKIK